MSEVILEEQVDKPKKENVCPNCATEIPLPIWQTYPIIQCITCHFFINRKVNIEREPESYAAIPDIRLRWTRMQEHISFTKSRIFLILGIRGSGKSSLLEALAVRHPKIIDLYGSSDMESLCWCKPEFEKVWKTIHGYAPRILLICGKNKEIASRFESCHINDLILNKIEQFDVITTVEQFFKTDGEYFSAIARIVEILWKQRLWWTEPWFVLVREASNWLYARTKVIKNDKTAKAEFIKALRESRHHGLSMAVDTLRWTALDKEIRDISDYIWIKQTGAIGLPEDLRWLYRYYKFFSIMRMRPNRYILTTSKGSVGHGTFDYPSWHKEEKENILKSTGIEIRTVGNALPDTTRNFNLGNFEHSEIIKTYSELRGMQKTATELARSYATVRNHIAEHNASFRLHGKCMKCYNAKGEFTDQEIMVGKVGRRTVAEQKEVAKKRPPPLVGKTTKKAKKFHKVNLDD